jgi:hypothetical protein
MLANVDLLLLEGRQNPDEYVAVGTAAAVHAQAGRAAFPVEDLGPAVPVDRLADVVEKVKEFYKD